MERIFQAVLEVLADEVELALLFGSRARDATLSRSDVDIGVLLSPEVAWSLSRRLDLAVGLERLLGAEVDLLDLDEATPLLRYEAARGICLYEGRPGVYADFVSRALLEMDDVRPHLLRCGMALMRSEAERG